MNAPLTIQEVAVETGLSEHTLRYYERIGLIESVNRAGNGHRRYTEHDVDWIELLKCMRATGMPIEQMKRFSDLVRSGDHTISERLELLTAHRKAVLDSIEELKQYLKMIEYKIDCYSSMQED